MSNHAMFDKNRVHNIIVLKKLKLRLQYVLHTLHGFV